MKDCKDKCEKYNCNTPIDNQECNHDWVYNTDPINYYNENGELCYRTKKHCAKCGATETRMHVGFI